MKRNLLLMLLFFIGLLCQTNAQHSGHHTYHFPQKSVISSYGANCIEDPTDIFIDLMNNIDRGVLSYYEVTAEEEREIGEQIHNNFEYTYINDERTAKLKSILSKIKRYVERSEVNYTIFLIEDDQINAWTIPGGYIYFTTGMYEFAENDHELANIIGHEVGHNENRHTSKFIQREKQKRDITNVTGVDVGLFVNLYSMATVAYNQPQEIESDYSGFYLAYKAGYEPEDGLELWRRLSEREDPNILGKLFRSHPYSNTRYRCGKEYIENAKYRN
jgi:predicted Zn-dependent protease